MAYQPGQLALQAQHQGAPGRVPSTARTGHKLVDTTMGRVIFNQAMPQDLGFKTAQCLDDMFELEIDERGGQEAAGQHRGPAATAATAITVTAQVLDDIKALGFKYSTRGAHHRRPWRTSWCLTAKRTMLAEAEDKVHEIERPVPPRSALSKTSAIPGSSTSGTTPPTPA